MAFRYNALDTEAPGQAYKKGKFSFPLEDANRYASKLQFQVVQITPPTFGSKFSTAETLDKLSRGEAEATDFSSGEPAKLVLGSKCDLYMPQGLQITDTIGYSTPELGAPGAVGLAAAQTGAGLIGAASQAIGEGVKGVSDFLGSLSGADIGRLGAVRASQLIPGETAGNVISIAAQASINPNVRAMFSKVNLRRFTFQFKFIPVSEEESRQLQTIIKFFRYHAYPKDILSTDAISLGYEYPDMFRIKAFTKVDGKYIQNGTHIKDCYLESISAAYNPTQATFHRDGSPTEIDLSLNFLEHRTLSRDDVESPYVGNDGIRVEITPNATPATEGSS